jgi:hypothetical protein
MTEACDFYLTELFHATTTTAYSKCIRPLQTVSNGYWPGVGAARAEVDTTRTQKTVADG